MRLACARGSRAAGGLVGLFKGEARLLGHPITRGSLEGWLGGDRCRQATIGGLGVATGSTSPMVRPGGLMHPPVARIDELGPLSSASFDHGSRASGEE